VLLVALAALAALTALACREDERSPVVRWSPSGTGGVVRTSSIEAEPASPNPIRLKPAGIWSG